jgi:hypothetical protein
MSEAEWVEQMASELKGLQWLQEDGLCVQTGVKLAYGCEIRWYAAQPEPDSISFETDLAVIETAEDGRWKPRVVVEAKLKSITTHDAITYSQKAASHKAVHPYLRYGIMLGDRKHYPLPGRLFRHGAHFDFMISFRATEPTESENTMFVELLRTEVSASRTLERILLPRHGSFSPKQVTTAGKAGPVSRECVRIMPAGVIYESRRKNRDYYTLLHRKLTVR